jgi:hypothetical protein
MPPGTTHGRVLDYAALPIAETDDDVLGIVEGEVLGTHLSGNWSGQLVKPPDVSG